MTPEEKLQELLEDMGRGAKAKLATYLKVSPVYVTRWVNDEKYNIPRDMIVKIEDFFKLPRGYLLSGNDEIKVKYIPLIGIASCGVPNIAYNDDIEYIPVNPELAREGVYAVKAEGESMLPDIKEGDVIICDKNMECNNGDIVHYTTIDGDSGLKKYLIDDKGVVTLMPANTNFPPIMCDVRDVKCARAFKRIGDL